MPIADSCEDAIVPSRFCTRDGLSADNVKHRFILDMGINASKDLIVGIECTTEEMAEIATISTIVVVVIVQAVAEARSHFKVLGQTVAYLWGYGKIEGAARIAGTDITSQYNLVFHLLRGTETLGMDRHHSQCQHRKKDCDQKKSLHIEYYFAAKIVNNKPN